MASAKVEGRSWHRAVAPPALIAGLVFSSFGACAQALRSADLAELSIEELANLEITSVSRRAERLADAPASVFVITGDDIRRAGVTGLPEALRLAPNLQMARIDSRQYAITARGFNGTAASNKLLVLIDGRAVYTPLFSGVFRDAQDVLLEDMERIEVISGPGATLWGAKAVPDYTALDARYGWRLQRSLEFSITARNLFDRRHPEFGAAATRAEIDRGLLFALKWSS
jgi:iron complex outermembrane receptor protein